MSSGSYLTLYRKYKYKISAGMRKSVEAQYAMLSDSFGASSKPAMSSTPDLPYVLDLKLNAAASNSGAEDCAQDKLEHDICSRYLKALRDDSSYVEELLSWNFGSAFSCLRTEWNMSSYSKSKSQHEISVGTAKQILQACNYLLGGNWSS